MGPVLGTELVEPKGDTVRHDVVLETDDANIQNVAMETDNADAQCFAMETKPKSNKNE